MSLYKYEVFVEVARTQSMSHAAKNLNQTVPGVSYTISKLEDELGIPLLVRNRSKIRLTMAAERLLPHMIAVLSVEKRLQRELADIKTLKAGSVRVGSISAVARQWLPELIQQFRSEFPQVEVTLSLGGYEELTHGLIHTNIDFAFMVDPHCDPVHFLPIRADRFYALLPSDEEYQPLMDKSRLSLDDLRAYPLIVPDWGVEQEFNHFLDENGLRPHVRYFISDAGTIVNMAHSGFGIGMLSDAFLDLCPEDLVAAPIEGNPFRTLGVATNGDLRLTVAAENFYNYALAWLRDRHILEFKPEQE